ncbi:hypothetical protein [Alteromonas macleodii]|uniref:hypothetical protein n=1 Tax=Alteromonas macleodii TaxID=28108 RepID=UPI0031408F67
MKWSFAIGLFTLTTVFESKLCTSEPLYEEQLIGIPACSESEKIDAVEAAQIIEEYIDQRLPTLQNWKDYDSLKENKAIAVRYHPPTANPFVPMLLRHRFFKPNVGYWGGGWEFETIEGAREAALKQCKDSSCFVYLANDTKNIPDDKVRELVRGQNSFVESMIGRISESDQRILFETISESQRKTGKEGEFLLPIAVPDSVKIGYPDRQQDYASSCQDRIFYGLLQLHSQQTDNYSKMKQLSEFGTYAPYWRRTSTPSIASTPYRYSTKNAVPDDVEVTRHARYVATKEFVENPITTRQILLPYNLEEFFEGKTILRIAVEGAARTTSSGELLRTDDFFAPIYIETANEAYFGVEIRLKESGDGNCYVGKPFSNEVARYSGCRTDTNNCAGIIAAPFLRQLELEFEAEPFSAHRVQNEVFPPGEFAMQRKFQNSLVLGRPNYEYSSYSFEAWAAPSPNPFGSLYGREGFRVGSEGRYEKQVRDGKFSLFLNVGHYLTKAIHRNGTYQEPSPTDVSSYEKAIGDAVNRAIVVTCEKYSGEMQDGICMIDN